MSTTTTHIGGATRQLVLNLLQELLHQIPEGIPQRIDDRHAMQAPLTLGVMLGEVYRPLYHGWGTDLSPDGLGILTEHELPPGVEIFVSLEALAGRPLTLPTRVIYCRQILPHTYRIGAALMLED